MTAMVRWAEAAVVVFSASSVLWVLGVQAVGLLRALPRERFLSVQMQLVKVWADAVVGLAVVLPVASVLRAGVGVSLLAPVVALTAAALIRWWALPRALRQGGQALAEGSPDGFGAGSFLASGGGEATHLWHRVVVALAVVFLAALAAEASSLAPG